MNAARASLFATDALSCLVTNAILPRFRRRRQLQPLVRAQEHAGHLFDLDPLWMARVDDVLPGRETLAVADPDNRKTHEANQNLTLVHERACIRVSSSRCVRGGRCGPGVAHQTLVPLLGAHGVRCTPETHVRKPTDDSHQG